MSRSRIAGVLIVVAGTVWLAIHVAQGRGSGGVGGSPAGIKAIRTYDRPPGLKSSAECRACHLEVDEEWRASHHAIAYTNPEVQRLSKGFQDRDCLPCHLPRPVWETGLGVRVLERASGHDDGVDCFTCHFDPKANAMLGRGPLSPAAASAPCQPAATPDIASLKLCAPCHNQHKVHEEWRQTIFAVPGAGFRDCNDCHMPKVERPAGPDGRVRTGRSHRFPAAHDAAMLRSAGTLDVVTAANRRLLITVKNTGAGHNFPTDERHRAVDLNVIARSGDGKSVQIRVDRYRNPYRQEFDLKNKLREPGAERDHRESLGELGEVAIHSRRVPAEFNPVREAAYPESTQIPSGEARSYTLHFPEGVKETTVRLIYRIQPFQTDEEAVVLYEKTAPLR